MWTRRKAKGNSRRSQGCKAETWWWMMMISSLFPSQIEMSPIEVKLAKLCLILTAQPSWSRIKALSSIHKPVMIIQIISLLRLETHWRRAAKQPILITSVLSMEAISQEPNERSSKNLIGSHRKSQKSQRTHPKKASKLKRITLLNSRIYLMLELLMNKPSIMKLKIIWMWLQSARQTKKARINHMKIMSSISS